MFIKNNFCVKDPDIMELSVEAGVISDNSILSCIRGRNAN